MYYEIEAKQYAYFNEDYSGQLIAGILFVMFSF